MERKFNLQFDTGVTSERAIGRKIFPVVRKIDTETLKGYAQFVSCFNGELAGKLDEKLKTNSKISSCHIFGDFRPVSTYYSLYNNRLYLEWGQVSPDSETAKLHDMMGKDPVYRRRTYDKCAPTRSGHMSQIYLPNCDNQVVTVALFDRVSIDRLTLTPRDEEYLMVTTLLANHVIPISSDGYPIMVSCNN